MVDGAMLLRHGGYFDMEEFFEWRASHLEEESSEEDFPDDQVLSTENPADRDEAVAA